MKKKIVALLLTLVMLVGIIPAAVYAAEEAETKVVLTVTPDKTIVQKGDKVTFTISMASEYDITSMEFVTSLPDELVYVDNSGKIDDEAKALQLAGPSWTEWSTRIGAKSGENFINAYQDALTAIPAGKDGLKICSFEAVVADTAEVGEYSVGLAGLDSFCYSLDWTSILEEEIKVDSTPVTVVDHFCADNTTEVAGKDATCDEAGVVAHFVCGKCGTKYTDATASEVFAGETEIPAKGHGEYAWVVVTPATCTAKGLEEETCPDCGDVKDSREIDILPHTEGEWKVVTEADCTAEGLSELRCTVCDALLDSKVDPAHGHVEGEWVVVEEGDCVTEGLKQLICANCPVVLKEEKTAPVGNHSYEAVVTAPTATAGGYTTYTCANCGDSYIGDFTDKVSGKVVLTVANKNNTILTGIVNSDYSAEISVPHGVTIDTSKINVGLTMTDVASLGIKGTKSFEKELSTGVNKEVVFDNYIPVDFVGATVSGTIDGVAYKYTFEGVDTAEKFTIKATPDAGVQPAWHALTSHITTASKSANDSYAYVPAAAYVQIGTEKLVFENEYKLDNISSASADELRAAVTLYDVEALDYAQAEIYLPAGTVIALSNYEATLADEAIITIAGYEDSEAVNTIMSQLRACETTTDIIKTLVLFIGDVAMAIDGKDVTLNVEFGHDYTAVVTEPTCTTEGFTTYTCSICGDTYKDDIVAPLAHDYTSVVTEPTCTSEGFTTYTCANCGDTYVADYVDALPHAYESEIIAPTCTTEGYTICTCANCGDTHNTAYVDALGHTAAEAVKENEVAATCTAAGSYDSVVYCSVCGFEMSRETVAVAQLAHDYKAVVTAPTCTAEGFTTYTCANCGDSYVSDKVAAAPHTAGEWVADKENDGYYNKFCTVCGTLLETSQLKGFDISDEYVKTKYVRKAPAFTLTAIVDPEDSKVDNYKVVWSSSNEKVATVDEDGNVTTHHFGTATITATLVDGEGNEIAKEACVVDVYYTFCQWLIWFFLLGCTWYFV